MPAKPALGAGGDASPEGWRRVRQAAWRLPAESLPLRLSVWIS
ncbi:hypothetical protein OICFNHDK_1879 [Methylobacterium bullatum]|uniref:Uncharacterized protein n=1 Tax=Methylobacterium bullatum TaxID=570505 RepID=A0A679K630_9HYPH|nr:hypothetical protein OICFNHDK_1879 [Methylobacterium bullatum]CAA2143218.1 hypothetical protein MBLL_02709 [Methylobacterium bullatum]